MRFGRGQRQDRDSYQGTASENVERSTAALKALRHPKAARVPRECMNEPYKRRRWRRKVRSFEPGHTFATVTDKISSIVLTRPASNGWFVGFGLAFLLTMMMLYAVGYLFIKGIGIWGVTIPIGWGFAIVNFVWWIGIGHAGTLISAILLLLRQSWRNSINRFAEAMTLVRCGLRRDFSRCCTSAVPGWLTGCSRIPTPWECGRNSAAR